MSELKACLKDIRSISIDLLNLIDNTEIVGDYDIYDIKELLNKEMEEMDNALKDKITSIDYDD